jgi:magnesium transporter
VIRSLAAPAQMIDDDEVILRRNLTPDNLQAAIEEDNTLVWVDMTEPDDEEIQWLEKTLKLHPNVVADLRRDDRRPALIVYPEYMFISLFQPRLNKLQMEGTEIHCLIGATCFVTVRHKASSAIDGAYERAAQNTDYWRRGVTYMLYMSIQFVIDSYYPMVDKISNQLNKLEETVMENGGKAENRKELQRQVFRLKQQLINLRQMVSPQREVISSMIGEERLSRTGDDRELFRHLYERLLRIYDVIDSQRDLASNVLDLMQSQESTQLANGVSRLTMISMVFLPLTFLVGLFGLNFVETEPPLTIPMSGALVFVLIIAATLSGAGLLGLYFRRRGWL